MDPFCKVHGPRWQPPQGCMSCAEIRWWMLELKRRGWTAGVLARTLGMARKNWRKATGREWIYPTEQLRMSVQLRRIISGELVLKQRVNGFKLRGVRKVRNGQPQFHDGVPVYDAVLADDPQPLRMPQQIQMRYDLRSGRLVQLPTLMEPENPLPSFKRALENLRKGTRSCP